MSYAGIDMESHSNSEIASDEPDTLADLLTEYESGRVNREAYLAQLADLITKDRLTGLLNKEGVEKTLDREIKIHQRNAFGDNPSKHSIAVLLIDGDKVKQINDTYGHSQGDEAIRTIARSISAAASRPSDNAGRFGKGDEFLVILPQTDLTGALVVAENIRQNIAQAAVNNPMFAELSASIGVTLHTEGQTTAQLIKNADQAMYRAKKARNSIAIHPDNLPQEPNKLQDLTTFIQEHGIKVQSLEKSEPLTSSLFSQ